MALHPFTLLSKEASSKHLCWKLACTTCWSGQLREMITKLCWDRFIRLDRNYYRIYPIQQKVLIEKVMDLPIKELLQESLFPDCLGHLGIVLSMVEYIEKKNRTLTKAWIPQFLELLSEDSPNLKAILENEDRYLRCYDLEEVELKTQYTFIHHSF